VQKTTTTTLLLDAKRGKEKFLNSVRLCTSNKVLTHERIQKFAKQARRYILGYRAIYQASIGNDQQDNENSEQILPAKLEQMVQKVKTHRCAMDFDHGFCKAIFRECN
jgi:hypothetical protein